MIHNTSARPRGLTLIETIVVISIFAVVSIVIGSIYIGHSKLYTAESGAADVKLQKSIFIKNIEEAAANASGLVASYTFGGNLRSSTSSTAIFQLPAIDSNENIIPDKFDYEVFYREESRVFAEVSADAASQRKNQKRQLADTAQNLIFQYNSAAPQDATVITSLLYLASGNSREKIQISVQLRNK